MIIATDVARLVSGPFLAACALLVIAGVAKITHPAPAQLAARAAGFGTPRLGIVAFGFTEVLAGIAGALFGGVGALIVAACYIVLTVVALRLLARAPSTPCACLGSSNAVVTPTHVVINVVAAAFAIVAATGGSPFSALSGNWLPGAAFVILVGCCVKLATLALEALPVLAAATKEGTT